MDNARGALVLTKESLSSKYLLLHTSEDKSSGELWKIIGEGFRVISQEALKKLNYPSPSQRNYMIVKIEKVTDPEFKDVTWDFKNLSNFSTGRASAFPFTTSLQN